MRRCQWRGIGFEVVACGSDEPLPEADLYYLGGGQDRDQMLVAADLQGKASDLRAAVDGGAAVLAVCGGYQLLGHRYRGHHGDDMPGTGLVDLETVAGDDRMIGNVTLECDLGDGRSAHARGLREPRRPHPSGHRACEPLGRVVRGRGNNGEDGGEGVRDGRVIGTYVHGPLLPKNPWLADLIIAEALERRHGRVALEPLDDALELESQRVAAIRG